MHLTAEQLDRVLAGGIRASADPQERAHLAGCAQCAARLEALRRETAELGESLKLLDHPAPAIDPRFLMRRRRRGLSPLRAAAAASIVLAIMASSALAFPRSPLRTWLDARLHRVEAPARAPLAEPEPVDTPARPPLAPGGGISLPVSGPTRVVFAAPQVRGELRIRLAPSRSLSVRGTAGSAGFSLDPQGIQIDNQGSMDSYEIVIPEDAAELEIRVGSRIVFSLAAGSVVTDARRTGEREYSIPLAAATGQ